MTRGEVSSVEQLVAAALAQVPEQRVTFLAAACRDQPEMLEQAQALLLRQNSSGDRLEWQAANDSSLEPAKCETTRAYEPQAGDTHANEADSRPPPRRIGRYNIELKLGRGGFGTVYLAKDPHIDRQVAIKVPRRQGDWTAADTEELLSEARAAARFVHPGVVAIYDADVCSEQGPFIVMEYVAGCSLRARLSAGRLSLGEAARLIGQVAQAVHAGHRRGLCHRDLKPENILLSADGETKVSDFGLAVDEQGQARLKGECAGTHSYMSPEQVEGDVHLLDGRSDIWALGVILYECLTGRRPFTGEDEDLDEQILHRSPRPLRQIDESIPAEVDKLCLQCLSKSIEGRPASAIEVMRRLQPYMGRPRRRKRFVATSLAMTALALVAIALGGWWFGPRIWRGSDAAARSETPAMETPGVDAGEAALVAVATSPDATDSNDDRIAVAEQEPGHTFENSVGMSFVLVPGGEFWMGSPNTEQDSGAIERPQHRVTISRDFYVGAWEVTQGQYTTVAGENPSHFRDGPPETALLRPVENVSWNEAVAFCDALSRRPAEREVGRVYRLLSEAEWEYACRAGSREGFAFGSKLTASDAHFGMSTSSAPASVGSYSQNEFGLFDMHGNVWEWCSDRFAEYQAAAQIDPAGSQSANLRVIRGGCTSSKADECRSASRAAFAPEDGVKYIGFRVVCEVRQP